MNILYKYAERIAEQKAQEIDNKLMRYIAKKGFIRHLFGRFLFIWVDTKDLKLFEEQTK